MTYAVRVVEVGEYLRNEEPSNERAYFSLYDAQTVVEIEVRNLMQHDAKAMLTKVGDIYVVVTSDNKLYHVYVCDLERRDIMPLRKNMVLGMGWYNRVYAEHRDSFQWTE